MKGLWCDAVQLPFMSVSCAFDPNYHQQAQQDNADGRQSQKHPGFSSIPSNIRFTRDLRGSSRGVFAGGEALLPFAEPLVHCRIVEELLPIREQRDDKRVYEDLSLILP